MSDVVERIARATRPELWKYLDELVATGKVHTEFEKMKTKSLDEAKAAVAIMTPVDMLLFCPQCNYHHIDKVTSDWDNPPHRLFQDD